MGMSFIFGTIVIRYMFGINKTVFFHSFTDKISIFFYLKHNEYLIKILKYSFKVTILEIVCTSCIHLQICN